jgi:hypothetical protein
VNSCRQRAAAHNTEGRAKNRTRWIRYFSGRATGLIVALGLILALCFGGRSASAATLTVGLCQPGGYSTIQSAINAAAAGDTMNVCAGVYPEDVAITKKLTLAGINQKHQLGVPTIVYPGKSDKPLCSAETYGVCPQIFVNEATVKITGMRIDDSAFPADTCFGTPMGILFLNA